MYCTYHALADILLYTVTFYIIIVLTGWQVHLIIAHFIHDLLLYSYATQDII